MVRVRVRVRVRFRVRVGFVIQYHSHYLVCRSSKATPVEHLSAIVWFQSITNKVTADDSFKYFAVRFVE